MKDEYICYRTQCRYHSGNVSGSDGSCNYFFITGETKTSRGEADITRKCGLYKPDTVQKWRLGAGLPPRYRQEIDRARLKELWEAGMDDPHIAKELGVSTMSAWRARNGMGLPTQKERAKE